MSQVTQKQFTEFRAELKSDIKRLEDRLDSNIKGLDGDIKALDKKFESKFSSLEDKFSTLSSDVKQAQVQTMRWAMGMFVTGQVAMAGVVSVVIMAAPLFK